MKNVRKIICVFFFVKILLPVFSQGYSSQQLVPAGHWIYDSLSALCLQTKFLSIADNAPLSVKELKFYFSLIDYDMLSDGGKILYDKSLEYLNQEKFAVNLKPVKIGLNLLVNPVLLGSTNKNIEWSMANGYCGQSTYNQFRYNSKYTKPTAQNGYKDVECKAFNASDKAKSLMPLPQETKSSALSTISAISSLVNSSLGLTA